MSGALENFNLIRAACSSSFGDFSFLIFFSGERLSRLVETWRNYSIREGAVRN